VRKLSAKELWKRDSFRSYLQMRSLKTRAWIFEMLEERRNLEDGGRFLIYKEKELKKCTQRLASLFCNAFEMGS